MGFFRRGKKEFKCPVCGMIFKTKEELEEHNEKAHPVAVQQQYKPESQPQTQFQPQQRYQPQPQFQPQQQFQPQSQYQPQSQFKVPLNIDVVTKCLCRKCPVQANSGCAQPKIVMMMEMMSMMIPEAMKNMTQDQIYKMMPKTSELPGPYCSIGVAVCNDLDFSKMCMCSQCQVFKEFNLMRGQPTEYFCRDGGAV